MCAYWADDSSPAGSTLTMDDPDHPGDPDYQWSRDATYGDSPDDDCPSNADWSCAPNGDSGGGSRKRAVLALKERNPLADIAARSAKVTAKVTLKPSTLSHSTAKPTSSVKPTPTQAKSSTVKVSLTLPRSLVLPLTTFADDDQAHEPAQEQRQAPVQQPLRPRGSPPRRQVCPLGQGQLARRPLACRSTTMMMMPLTNSFHTFTKRARSLSRRPRPFCAVCVQSQRNAGLAPSRRRLVDPRPRQSSRSAVSFLFERAGLSYTPAG